jgi:hypothetical protein
MKGFDLDQVQADAILEIRLYQLARLEISKILEERAAKKARLKEVEALLKNPKARWKIIREDLERIAEKFGDKRRSKIGNAEELEYNAEAYIVVEETTVLLSRDGWLRRVRELKDPSSARLREGDALQAVLPGTSRDHLVLYSSHGSVYVLRVADVPATTGLRRAVQSLLKFGDGERSCPRSSSATKAGRRRAKRPSGQQSLFGAPAGEGRAARDDPRRDGARVRLPRGAGPDRDDARRPSRRACGRRRRGRVDRAGRREDGRRRGLERKDAALPDRRGRGALRAGPRRDAHEAGFRQPHRRRDRDRRQGEVHRGHAGGQRARLRGQRGAGGAPCREGTEGREAGRGGRHQRAED